jgi:hypothetical protein
MSISNFQAGIRAMVRALWLGSISRGDFVTSMSDLINRELWNAWIEGMDACGITPGDMEPDERRRIDQEIQAQLSFVDGFADDILTGNKYFGGDLQTVLTRSDMWVNRYDGIRTLASTMVCGNEKLEWIQGATEQGCDSCGSLDGIVKRASYWERMGVHPRNAENLKLACQGWRCDCSLEPTSKPCTPGPLPNLP